MLCSVTVSRLRSVENWVKVMMAWVHLLGVVRRERMQRNLFERGHNGFRSRGKSRRQLQVRFYRQAKSVLVLGQFAS